MDSNTRLIQAGAAASIVLTTHGIVVQEPHDFESPFALTEEELWFDDDFKFMLKYVYEQFLEEIESDITSDWSTNESE